jgi:hypothetical protein
VSYASDTIDVTRLAVTLGGRYNLALIQLVDKIGTALSGSARFSRFNPSAKQIHRNAMRAVDQVIEHRRRDRRRCTTCPESRAAHDNLTMNKISLSLSQLFRVAKFSYG